MKLLVLIVIIKLILLNEVASQIINIDSLIMQNNQIILKDDPVFFISEETYYEAKIINIYKFKQGYGIFLEIFVSDSIKANVFVVSAKERKKGGHKIKIGNVYSIKLIDYFVHLLHLSIEKKEFYDVMIGGGG